MPPKRRTTVRRKTLEQRKQVRAAIKAGQEDLTTFRVSINAMPWWLRLWSAIKVAMRRF